ncbi:hypothetical protein CAP36_07915 [Chitinophagaceae bacterium IBVUCB2]|nr:hypothetical protein CAP36_07915 [Chitinophagaceae bacterium IBVUCB2]
MDRVIKIFLAVLLLICLAKMPYGFYQIVRFLAMAGFALLAYESWKNENKMEAIIFISLAVLFQPLMKISLGREIWNIVDVIVASGLLISLLANKNFRNEK